MKLKLNTLIGTACAASIFALSPLQQAIAAELQRPNIVTIVLDDMGFSDISPYGGEIQTPTLQQFADQGMVFNNFYAAPTSTPSRAMLFTGKDPHKVGVGNMEGWARPQQSEPPADASTPPEPLPEYAGKLMLGELIFPQLLQQNGYHTMMSGKWDLSGDTQDDPAYLPNNRGFDQTFVLVPGGDDHWLQYRAQKYNENGQAFEDFKEGDYSTTFFTDKALAMLEKRDQGKPFYLNVSYTAPHTPWHAPAEVIAKYEAVYAKGWDKIREERFASQKAGGLIPQNTNLAPRNADTPAWDSLTPEQQQYEAKRMAVYAAMVDVVDQNIARLTDYLKAQGLYENTLFIVVSDNGATAAQSGTPQFLANIDGCVDNGYANLGSSTSFPGASPGWGMVSNTPFNHYKADTYEGGVRVPLLVHYPRAGMQGTIDSNVRSMMDIAPTILDLAGVTYPYSYQGRPNRQMDGVSMLKPVDPDRWLAWELDGVKGVLKGGWKLAQKWISTEDRWEDDWHLYNLADDLTETRDLIAQHPEKFAELLETYWEYADENKIVDVNGRILVSNLGAQLNNAGGSYPLADAMTVGGSRRTVRHPDPTVLMPAREYYSRNDPYFGPSAKGLYQAGVDVVEIEAEINPPAEHVNYPAEVFVEAAYTTAEGQPGGSFGLNQQGQWTPVSTPKAGPVYMQTRLPARLPVPIWPSNPLPLTGTLDITFGYRFSDGTSVSNAMPLRVELAPTLPHGPTASPQVCRNMFPWLRPTL